MSIWIPGILMTYGAFLFAVASPGPNVLEVMGVSMSDGRKAGIALAFGIAAACKHHSEHFSSMPVGDCWLIIRDQREGCCASERMTA